MDIQAALVGVAEKLMGWGYGLILLLPNFVAAFIVMLTAFLLSRLVRKVVLRAMAGAITQEMLARQLATIAQWLMMIVGLFIALGVLKLDKTVTSLLAGAGVIGLALAFAFQDIASNFLAGVLLALRRPFSTGHIIKTNDFLGTVEELNLRSTHLRTPEGQMVILPNATVFQKPITNFSMSGLRRVDLPCGVSYRDDLEKAQRVATAAIDSLPMAEKGLATQFYFTEFGESSVQFVVRFWIKFRRQPDYLEARSQGIKAIKAAFDREGLTIPFPIRTLDLDLGDPKALSSLAGIASGKQPNGR